MANTHQYINRNNNVRVTVSRRAHFNAAHRLYRADWSDERNEQVFGKCNNPNFHGHNYELVVGITGEVDPETGYVIDIKDLKDIIEQEVEVPFDHKNLNLDVPDFASLNPTAENIAVVIWDRIRKRISEDKNIEVVLYETPRNFVTYRGE